MYGDCGEVVNTADCSSVMRGFDPHQSPQTYLLLGRSQAVRLGTLTPASVVRIHPPQPHIISPRQLPLGRRQAGKARDFDSRMRWFESSRPSHLTH